VFATPNPRPEPNVVLEDLVRRVAEASGRDFLIHAPVPARIYVRGTLQETPTYSQLLSILRTNGLTIFMAEDIVNIVPDANARSMPTRVVQEDDDRIPDDEIVTRVIRTQHVPAAQLVPALRPMQPQEAHLTAMTQSNTLVIVDRYANVRRITEVIRMMDVESEE
jgi:general secretion pathway protein D